MWYMGGGGGGARTWEGGSVATFVVYGDTELNIILPP